MVIPYDDHNTLHRTETLCHGGIVVNGGGQ